MNEPCRILPWDTEFFGFTVARVETPQVDVSTMPEILQWCARHRVRCLYLLTGAETDGFQLVDQRLTYSRHAQPFHPSPGIRLAQPTDLPALQQIAAVSHTDSRFYHDPNFPRERCAALYAEWIRKSLAGDAQAVFVADAGGYITCHWNGDAGSIGLVAVAENARGQGIGTQLVRAALTAFHSAGVHHVTVVTQGRNQPSRRLYQSCGFTLLQTQLWHHRWFL